MAELIRREGNTVEFKVAVPATEVNKTYEQVWSKLSQDVRVPGFRPGKAPRKVIEGRVGKDYVVGQVTERVVNQQFQNALRELKLSLVDFKVQDFPPLSEGQGFEFVVVGEVYPEVKLGEWRNLKLAAQAPEITDEVLARTLADLQERNATFETVERPIEAGDQVTIQEEGQEGPQSYPLYLDMVEEHVRQALLGKQAGDEVEIPAAEAQNTEAEEPAPPAVKVKILSVRTKQLAALDEEFAKSLNFESLDKLRSDLRAELERRASSEGEQARREELIEHLSSGMQVDIPTALIKQRQDNLLQEIQDDLRRQGVQWREYESFMQEQGKLADFMDNLHQNAEQRLRRDLALEQLAEDLKVQVSNQDLNLSLLRLAELNQITPEQLIKQLGQQGINSYYHSMQRERALQQALGLLTQPSAPAASTAQPEAEKPGTPGDTESASSEPDENPAKTE